jgi:ABC-2 type transport system permease protein
MIGLIARRELLELHRDGRLPWTGGLLVVLLLLALIVGWQRQAESRAERAAASALDYDAWVAQPARHPHDAAHQGMHVFKPVPALAVIDPGVTPYVGSTLWLQAHRQSEVKFRPAQDATGLQRFGSLSPAWLLQVLGPLLVIVLGFNSLSGEREQGTLRQVLSLGIAPGQLLAGKALGLLAALALLLAPATLAGSIVVLVAAELGERVDALLRLALLGFGYAVYLAIFVGLVLAVSARARSARLSLTVLLALWIGIAILAPRGIADLSRQWFPSASRQQFNAGLDSELGQAYQRAWNEQVGGGTPFGTEVPLSQWGRALAVHDHAGYAVMDRHFGALWDSYANQQAVQEWAGLLLPTVALRAYSMGIAGTDFTQHRAFSQAAEQHRRQLQDVISHDLVEHADGRDEAHFAYRATPELWKAVPRFEHRIDSAVQALRHQRRSLLVLLASLVGVGLLARMAALQRGLL